MPHEDKNYDGPLVLDLRKWWRHVKTIYSRKPRVFRERGSRKNCELWGTEMSKSTYPSIFSRQMGAIVFIILQMFFVTRTVLKIVKNHSNIPQS